MEPDDFVTVHISDHSESFADDPPYAPQFYEVLGRVIVLWGRFEQTLDNYLQMVINIAARHGIERQMRVPLSKKTKLLREIYPICPGLAEHTESVCEFLTKTEGTSDERNLLIHSNVIGFEDGDPPKLILHNQKHKSGNIIFTTLKPTVQDIERVGSRIDALLGFVTLHLMQISPLQPGFETAPTARRQVNPRGGSSPPKAHLR